MNLVQRLVHLVGVLAHAIKQRITPDYPGVAKAWVCFTAVDGVVQIRASFNIAEVKRLAVGRYRIYFSAPLADTHYCWFGFARNVGQQTALKIAAARALTEQKTRDYVEVICSTVNGSLSDTSEMNVVVLR